MAENSKISWCDHTFNPWIGCTKVSQGCKHCYAEALMDHRYGRVQWGPEGTRVRTSDVSWRKPLAWNRKAAKEGRRYKVFCASLADVFEDRPELVEWRVELFRMIVHTPALDWLLLTKRPENILPMLEEAGESLLKAGHNAAGVTILRWLKHGVDYAPPNVWLGTSVENQEQADKRIPELLKVPARIRFLSCEPLLGPVDFDPYFGLRPGNRWADCLCDEIDPADRPCLTCEARQALGAESGISWVIAGAESGHGARPMDLDWVRGLRDQCQWAGVPFFFKQAILAGKKTELPLLDGQRWAQFPE